MAVNKVVYNTEDGAQTLIDLTSDSVTPETLAKGATAHDASGNVIEGILEVAADTMVGTWVLNEVPDITLDGFYPVKISKADADFEINGLIFAPDYNEIELSVINDPYIDYDMYYVDGDWYHDRTITITEEPTDPDIIAWIKANAKKQGTEVESSNFEMPIIRFANFQDTEGDLCLSETNPYKFTIEILGGGALKEGDLLQICVRRKYKWGQERSKWRLRSVVNRDITSEDIGKRFLSIDVTLENQEMHGNWLFRNDRCKKYDTYSGEKLDTLSYMYFRIKRVTKYTSDGVECDAIFSNVEKVAKTYDYGANKLTIK